MIQSCGRFINVHPSAQIEKQMLFEFMVCLSLSDPADQFEFFLCIRYTI